MSEAPALRPMLRHLRAILALPFLATVVVPYLLVRNSSRLGPLSLVVTGCLLLVVGVALVSVTIHHFATRGRGTLAPWDPPRRLVISGIYRYMRNPMITGVAFVLLGESLVFASAALTVWAAVFILANALYIPLVEEPALLRRFGTEYDSYRTHVPRWLPRRSAWRSDHAQGHTPAA